MLVEPVHMWQTMSLSRFILTLIHLHILFKKNKAKKINFKIKCSLTKDQENDMETNILIQNFQ